MHLDRQGDANRTANVRAHSVETCDLHYTTAANYTNPPWDADQIPKLIQLGIWECDHFAIPRRICRTPDDPGLGWHGMWDNTRFELTDGTSPWSPSAGKSCPNPNRRRQLVDQIIPAIIAGEDNMTPAQETKLDTANKALVAVAAGLAALRRDMTVTNTSNLKQTTDKLYGRAKAGDLQSAAALVVLAKLDVALTELAARPTDTAAALTDLQVAAIADQVAAAVEALSLDGTVTLRRVTPPPAPVL
jgi:hypothetical protein